MTYIDPNPETKVVESQSGSTANVIIARALLCNEESHAPKCPTISPLRAVRDGDAAIDFDLEIRRTATAPISARFDYKGHITLHLKTRGRAAPAGIIPDTGVAHRHAAPPQARQPGDMGD